MSDLALAFRQVRYESRSFWRNAAAAFFTFVFPLIILVLFNLIFGDEKYEGFGRAVSTATFYIPAITAFAVIQACYTQMGIGVVFARDQGTLKRIRGAPLPPWAWVFGRVLHAIVISVILVVIVVAFGRAFYDVSLPGRTFPAFVVSLAVGAATFCALGLAVTTIVPDADAAPAVVNVFIFPLLFISDVFIPLDNAPKFLTNIASVFPIKRFSSSLLTAFNPFTRGAGFEWDDIAVMAVWGVLGLIVALKFFRWEPRR